MRCDCCPLGSDEDVCPEAEGKYGIEHKDRVLGCTHPWNWVKKRDDDYCNYLGDMGTDMVESHISGNSSICTDNDRSFASAEKFLVLDRLWARYGSYKN